MEAYFDNYWFTWTALMLFMSIRYVAIAGVMFVWWYVARRERWAAKKIQVKFPAKSEYMREVGYSALTFLIFATIASVVYLPQIRPYTQLRLDVADLGGPLGGWVVWSLSLVAMLIVHDFYFYVMHRVVHHKKLYPIVHKVHHLSHNPTPWAAFSFHPFEAITEFLIFPIIAFTIPHTLSTIGIWLLLMTLYNAYGHLGFELYPKGFATHPVGRWINTSVNHNMHHKFATNNYGLYTLVWDRLFGTMHAKYDEVFDEVTSREIIRTAMPIPQPSLQAKLQSAPQQKITSTATTS
jgi:Delta7-sterol 5-desaturase